MARLVYIDTMRMVSPGSALGEEHFDYYLLGSFDAMKIIDTNVSSFANFQDTSRDRHTEVPVLYDKQPMCLYSDWNNPNSPVHIFDKSGVYQSKPLIMTLVQIHDEVLPDVTPDALIQEFKAKISNMISEDSDFHSIEFEVFYSLGEADIVLVFRDSGVRNIARLLHRFRTWDTTSDMNPNGIRILSICSHCAFPATTDEQKLHKTVQEWMNVDKSLDFFTLFDTSYGTDNNLLETDTFRFDGYLLGEFDYADKWPNYCDDKETVEHRTTKFRDEIVNLMLSPDTDNPYCFRTAYTTPIVKLQQSDKDYSKNKRVLKTIQTDYKTLLSKYENPDNSAEKPVFIQLAELTKKLPRAILGDGVSSKYLSNKVKAMAGTLVGLLKHLIRLKEGRFESDLYAYVAPIFEAMPEVVKSYIDLIERLSQQYKIKYNEFSTSPNDETKQEMSDMAERICELLNEYINDISRLISLLQHLFSVLSVSPHTYLETYGSNMRSIAATCKLLGAYQGISYRLSTDFGMSLSKYDSDGEYLGPENVTETMLILPYRSIRQSTRTLFEHSSPLNRIVSVRLDFADMMAIDKTLYILLHELGHHIIDSDHRFERKRLLVEAVLAYLLQYSISSIYDDPYSCLDIPNLMRHDVRKKEERIKWINDSRATKKKDITVNFAESIQDNSKEQYTVFEEELKKRADDIRYKSEPYALNNQFSEPLKDGLIKCVDDCLQSAYATDEHIELRQDDTPFVVYLRDLLSNGILRILKEVFDEQYNLKSQENGVDLWRLEELKVWYNEAKRCPKSKRIDKIIISMLKKIEEIYGEAVEEFFSMCSDIYCDIFAFYLLRLDEETDDEKSRIEQAGKYLRLCKDVIGFDVNTEVLKAHVLLRLEILLTKCYKLNKKDASNMIIRFLSQESPLKSQIDETLKRVESSAYYGNIEKYAEACIASIKAKRNGLTALEEDSKVLHRMYMNANGSNINDVVADVHYFWLESTKRLRSE